MSYYLFLYFSVFFVYFFFKKYSCSYWVIFTLVALFSGFRYQTGYDWPVYESFYNNGTNVTGTFNSGFTFFCLFFKSIGFNFNGFILVTSLITNFCVFYSFKIYFKKLKYIAVIIYILIPDLYLICSFSLLRFFISLSLIWYFLAKYQQNNKITISMYIVIVMSVLFHYSSLFFVLFFTILIFLKWKIPRNATFVMTIFLLLYLFNISIVEIVIRFINNFYNNKYIALYLLRDTYNPSLMLKLFNVILFLCLLFISNYLFRNKRINLYDYSMTIVCLFLFIFFYSMPTLSTRVPYFFVLPLLKCVIIFINNVRNNQRFLVFIIGVFITLLFNMRFLLSPFSIVYIPYQTYLNSDDVINSSGQQRTDILIDKINSYW